MSNKLKVISNFGFNFNLDVSKPCELYVDRIPTSPKNSVRFLWVIEPNEVSKMKQKIINNHHKFDFILAYDSDILTKCKNSILFPYGTTWINDFDFSIKKEYSITSIVGGKKMCTNHLLRHLLVDKINNITNIPVVLFNSSNNPYLSGQNLKTIQDKKYKNEVFYSQFHIAIENTTQDNWFTEKLIDCFQSKTVPIYIGCPNIGDFFDINGIIHATDLDDLIEKCKLIDENTYSNMLKYVEKNYELSFKYSDHIKSLTEKITELL